MPCFAMFCKPLDSTGDKAIRPCCRCNKDCFEILPQFSFARLAGAVDFCREVRHLQKRVS